jgi:hypothetical protein
MGSSNAPIFEGRPSPALKRMRQMAATELQAHLDWLRGEARPLERRLAHLQRAADAERVTSPPPRHIKRVAAQHRRVQTLIEAGGQLLAGQSP